MSGQTVRAMRGMIGSRAVCDALASGKPPAEIIAGWAGDVETWKRRRAPFLLYT